MARRVSGSSGLLIGERNQTGDDDDDYDDYHNNDGNTLCDEKKRRDKNLLRAPIHSHEKILKIT